MSLTPMKPGWKTTEFWITAIVQLVGLCAAAGVFTPDQAEQWQRVVEVAGGLVAMVLSNMAYAKSRGQVKGYQAEAEAEAACVPEDEKP